MFACFFLLFFCFFDEIESAVVKGNVLRSWGCNDHLQVGVSSPTGECLSDDSSSLVNRSVEYPWKQSFQDMPFKQVISAEENTAVLTYDDCIYVWGGVGDYILGPIQQNDTVFPILIHDGQGDSPITSFSCRMDCCGFLNEANELWHWGLNVYGELGTGSTNPVTLPRKARENVIAFDISTYVSVVLEEGNKVYVSGTNTDHELGRVASSTYTQLTYELVNHTVIGVEGENEINFIYNPLQCVFVIFSNNDVYGWGNRQKYFMNGGINDHQDNPVKVPIADYVLYEIDHIIDFSCYLTCLAIINHYGVGNIVYSWGDTGEAGLGRTYEGDGWLYPAPINTTGSEIEGKTVIQISTGRWSHNLLTDDGYLFVIGQNMFFDMETHIDRLDTSMHPVRILFDDPDFDNTNSFISFIPRNHWEHQVVLLTNYKCNALWGSSDDACSRNGDCIGENDCQCYDYYMGDYCERQILCNNKWAGSPTVCSGRGECIDTDTCVCDTSLNYTGSDCSEPICYDLPADDEQVCSGRGTCALPDQCVCDEPYYGDECEKGGSTNDDKGSSWSWLFIPFGGTILFLLCVVGVLLCGILILLLSIAGTKGAVWNERRKSRLSGGSGVGIEMKSHSGGSTSFSKKKGGKKSLQKPLLTDDGGNQLDMVDEEEDLHIDAGQFGAQPMLIGKEEDKSSSSSSSSSDESDGEVEPSGGGAAFIKID